MSDFNSAYDVGANIIHHPAIYLPLSSSSSHPTFNFDLYNPNEYHSQSFDYPSPSSSVIVHHHPVYSPPPSQAISKLRQINDELCYTLAQCDLTTKSTPQPSSPPHYHVHHYPISHSRSPSERDSSSSSSADSEPITKKT